LVFYGEIFDFLKSTILRRKLAMALGNFRLKKVKILTKRLSRHQHYFWVKYCKAYVLSENSASDPAKQK